MCGMWCVKILSPSRDGPVTAFFLGHTQRWATKKESIIEVISEFLRIFVAGNRRKSRDEGIS